MRARARGVLAVLVLVATAAVAAEPATLSAREREIARAVEARRSGAAGDLALAFEGAIRNATTVARRGISSWWLEVTGRPGHSSGSFGDKGVSQ